MTSRMFRYYKNDFGKGPLRVIHMDLIFDVFDTHTHVTSDLHAESLDRLLYEVVLDAKNLDIVAVHWIRIISNLKKYMRASDSTKVGYPWTGN